MISLYIHIPFCTSKCAYCSFNSMPIFQLENYELQITNYMDALKKEIDYYAETLTDKALKTLYFGGGTPSKIGIFRIIDIIEYIRTKFDFEELAELSIELNPYPEEEVLNFVEVLNKKYPKISRLRYSFGIQSFDDEVLKTTGRAYTFGTIVEFLRALVKLKQDNNVFNFDFIAFGKFQVSKNGFKQLWHEFKREFFKKFLDSGYVDSLSVYTLENIKDKPCPAIYYGTDDEIIEEFLILKSVVEDSGFLRYEISNFARAGKASIHNMVYWNMEPYIGLGLSASSFFGNKRRTNTSDIKQYLEGKYIDEKEVHVLNASDLLIEEFFLRLRTTEGIADLLKFISVLVPNYESLLETYMKAGLVDVYENRLQLTDEGMNVYNSIITDVLQKL
ncbi:MAG: coproporphyrinogen-III oxidase family protein [candidate division SR1 bacterium]|nr:coproporphyrinogen-III oxidase family protein [candidate division SR1 bacterium]